jgi:hypothetical protein
VDSGTELDPTHTEQLESLYALTVKTPEEQPASSVLPEPLSFAKQLFNGKYAKVPAGPEGEHVAGVSKSL